MQLKSHVFGDEVKTNEKHIQKKNHSKESNLVENLL